MTTSVRSKFLCINSFCLILAAIYTTVKCKPQQQAASPFSPPLGISFPTVGIYHTKINGNYYPFILQFPSRLSEVQKQQQPNQVPGQAGLDLHRTASQNNLGEKIQIPLKDSKKDRLGEKLVIFETEKPVSIKECGLTDSYFRNDPTIKNSGDEKTEPTEGTVLLTSETFDGPDLSDTAFNKHKGPERIFQNKITYGNPTRNKEAPWQVAMFVGGKFHCGASLISSKHILTAAHCVTAFRSRPHVIGLSIGDWDLKSKDDGVNVKASVKRISVHPDFNFFDLQNDIAVMELRKPVNFNKRIRPICLPPAGLEVLGVLITVTGWGRNERNLLQTKLQKLTAIVLDNSICADRWSRSGAPRSLIGTGTICMDTQYGDSCKGDSGGPATMEYPKGSGTYIQAGIVSFGSGSCTDSNLPGVYTRVSLYRTWIINQMSL